MRHTWRNLAAVAVTGVSLLAGWSAIQQQPAFARSEPTLGLRTGLFSNGEGFGQIRPKEVYNGGDPTGLVTSITWRDWGQGQAVGAGRSDYVAPNQSVAGGTQEPVRIVAFDLGVCNGHYMYASVEWYFPQHKQVFDASQFEDACIGAYYPIQTGEYQDGSHGYTIVLNGAPASLRGSVSYGKQLEFTYHGHAGLNGSLALVSNGPFEPGHTFSGSWQVLAMTLSGCHSYLRSAPSCTFYWGT
jgi:hypothetical protein